MPLVCFCVNLTKLSLPCLSLNHFTTLEKYMDNRIKPTDNENGLKDELMSVRISEAEDVTLTMRITQSEYCEIKSMLCGFMKKVGIKEVESAIVHYLLNTNGGVSALN